MENPYTCPIREMGVEELAKLLKGLRTRFPQLEGLTSEVPLNDLKKELEFIARFEGFVVDINHFEHDFLGLLTDENRKIFLPFSMGYCRGAPYGPDFIDLRAAEKLGLKVLFDAHPEIIYRKSRSFSNEKTTIDMSINRYKILD